LNQGKLKMTRMDFYPSPVGVSRKLLRFGVLCFTTALVCGSTQSMLTGQEKGAKLSEVVAKPDLELPSGPAEKVPYRGLDASLYMLTSAEYRAACHQCFRWAEMIVQLKQQLRHAQADSSNAKPLAVVMDLDETILDNGWFQTQQIRDRVAFDMQRWSTWEEKGSEKVRVIPGAVAFIKRMRELGVAPVFISNRNSKALKQTLETLERFEIGVPENQVLLADDQTGSDKTSRRAKVSQRFDVVLYLGDNLRDFDERFKFNAASGIEGRNQVVDELSSKFGIEWIILPNPSYGEWTKAFRNDVGDVDLLYK
jgi:5'-nucleotidase (lipoprotein e(P4) family)